MGTSCELIPKIKYNGQEVDSQLFPELVAFTGNREIAKDIFSITRSKEFIDSLDNIERNEVGEPTLKSLDRVLNIRNSLDNGISVKAAKKELNAETPDGKPVLYDSIEDIYNKVDSFNNENPKLVADIEQEDGRFRITVDPKTTSNIDSPQKLVFHNSLNNKLLTILRQSGFDIEIVDKGRFNAIFSPKRAETNAEGLLSIIKLVKGEKSEELFPEEFSHLMIEGLMNNPLISRLVNSLDSFDTLKTILGDEFQRYVSLYKGDMLKLQKEAAAKLIANSFNNIPAQIEKPSLLERAINFIKNIFSKINGTMIEGAIEQAKKDANLIAYNIINNDLASSIDKEAIINADTMYSAERELKGLEEMAERALEIASKRYYILQSRSRGKYNPKEYKKLKALQSAIERQKYALSCHEFIGNCLDEIKDLNDRITTLSKINSKDNLETIKNICATLRSIKEFTNAYSPIIKRMQSLNVLRDNGDVDIDTDTMNKIIELASANLKMINDIETNYKNLRYDTIYNFLKIYWGEDKLITAGKDKGQTITLEQIMKMADKDINFLDTFITAMSDASDPMLVLVDKIVKNTQNKRDDKLIDILNNVRTAHSKLEKAGYKTDFMFERDEDGNLTGNLISDIDFIKFKKDRKEYISELKKQKSNYHNLKFKLDEWDAKNTESIIVNDSGKVEVLPKMEIYGKEMKNRLEYILSPEQKEYYNYMIKLKSILDSMLPEKYTNLYQAIMIRNDTFEAVAKSVSDPKKAGKILKESLKDRFLRREDDLGFGDTSEGKKIQLDFNGNPIEKLPVYYTTPLKDMSRLSTDFTSSILAYASTAINYEEMNKVIDALELTRDYIKDEEGRKVLQKSGDQPIKQIIPVLSRVFSKDYTKRGERTNIGKRIDAYFKNAIYEERKEDEGSINFFGKKVDTTKLMDAVKNYSGAVGLGLNLFSGISNITMGKMQSFLEGVGGEYFNLKDAVKGNTQYWTLLAPYLAELNSSNKTNKMALLIEKFDALEEFYNDLRNKGYYNGALSRVVGHSNIYFLNNMGEHYLHTKNMLAMLNATKVKKGNKTISLYNALNVQTNEEGVSYLVLDEGVTDLNGNLLSTVGLNSESAEYQEVEERFTEYISNQKNRIGKVNQALNGAFNENDKGEWQRHSLGRLAMQFRQWMPAHYGRRFAAAHYDARLDQTREGFYRTFSRFIFDTMKDASKLQFNIITRWKQLSPHEQANIKKASTELLTFAILGAIIAGIGPEKDKKGKWGQRMMIYQLKRLRLETGASIPWISALESNLQIVQKPIAATTTVKNFIDVLKVWNMSKEIQNGRYKGYSQWEKDVAEAVPIYGQFKKAIDIKDEDSMFTIFNY